MNLRAGASEYVYRFHCLFAEIRLQSLGYTRFHRFSRFLYRNGSAVHQPVAKNQVSRILSHILRCFVKRFAMKNLIQISRKVQMIPLSHFPERLLKLCLLSGGRV